MPPPMASDGISRERFKQRSRNFLHLSGTIGLISLPDVTSLAIVSRPQNQNAIKYCIKVRETGPAGQRVE